MLSAVIITYNEARNIGRCLDSLAGVADEIVVVDSYSSDATQPICRAKGVRFVQHVFEGYGQQKNYALAQAAYDRILSLDADEALSPELAASIAAAKVAWPADGYTVSRLTNYCGRWIRHSGWYPDRKIRLFDRRKARWTTPGVHEKLELTPGSRVAQLDGELWHYSYYTVDEHVERARKYAALAARAGRERGQRVLWPQLLLSPAAKFIRNYLLYRGFLDGRAGFTISRIAALETYWKYKGML
jgi:glycosyltransferase involved in cell wall biosynthesis